MLGGLKRQRDAGLRAQLPRPHARADHHVIGADLVPVRHAHPHGTVPPHDDVGDGGRLEDPRATHLRALGERHRHVHRVRAPVLGDVEAGQHVAHVPDREELLHLAGRDLDHVDPVPAHEGRDAAHLVHALLVAGDLQVSHRAKAGGHARLFLEPGVEVAAVGVDLAFRLGLEQPRDDQPRGVPCRARCQAVTLQHHHVRHAELREVIGGVAADGAASDDHDACVRWQVGHGCSSFPRLRIRVRSGDTAKHSWMRAAAQPPFAPRPARGAPRGNAVGTAPAPAGAANVAARILPPGTAGCTVGPIFGLEAYPEEDSLECAQGSSAMPGLRCRAQALGPFS